jgi:hypothetical protein
MPRANLKSILLSKIYETGIGYSERKQAIKIQGQRNHDHFKTAPGLGAPITSNNPLG